MCCYCQCEGDNLVKVAMISPQREKRDDFPNLSVTILCIIFVAAMDHNTRSNRMKTTSHKQNNNNNEIRETLKCWND